MKLSKAQLEAIFRRWQREEAEAIDVIEAVGAYLGPERRPRTPAGRAALKDTTHAE